MGSSTLIMSGEWSLFPGSPEVLEEQEPGVGEAWPYVCVRFRVLKAAELYPKHCSIPGISTRWKRGLVGCSPVLCCCVGGDRTLWPLSLCTKCLMSPLGRRVKLNPPSLCPQEIAPYRNEKIILVGPWRVELVNLDLFACFSALSAQILSFSS